MIVYTRIIVTNGTTSSKYKLRCIYSMSPYNPITSVADTVLNFWVGSGAFFLTDQQLMLK